MGWKSPSKKGNFVTRTWQHSDNRENFVGAVVTRTLDQHLAQGRVQRELSHHLTQLRQVAVIVQRAQVVQQLQGTHQSLGGWRIHKVKVDQVVNTKFLQLKHHRSQVGTQNFGVSLWLKLFEGLFSVQSETFARLSTTGTTCSLLGRGSGNRRDQQRFDSDTRIVDLFILLISVLCRYYSILQLFIILCSVV